MSDSRAYLIAEGIDRLINLDPGTGDIGATHQVDITFATFDDLARVHRIVRARKPFTVLEIGSGYSTIVIADALRKNEAEWNALAKPPKLRNRFPFHVFTVETSKPWIEQMQGRLPTELAPYVTFHHSTARLALYEGQVCSFYDQLPDIVPGMIYLDGPNPADVEGSIHGLSFQCPERTVMAADPLLLESTLLPGFFMLVDGRTNNARFLQRNLKRRFNVTWDKAEDVTLFDLVEDRLGPVNILATDLLH